VRVRALENGQLSAAVTAIKEKGILSGKRIERAEIGTPGEFETMTDDELERALMERLERLGLSTPH
jgi:phage terminase small subunit